MIVRTFLILVIASLISGCSVLGGFFKKEKPIEIVTKPVQIEIIQPALPRELKLEAPRWYVVSEARIANPCREVTTIDEDGISQSRRPRSCDQEERENPTWPEGYSYLDRFFDDIKAVNGGDILFVAMSIKDYELMSANMQELRRYIRELGEVIIYYREVTSKENPTDTE